MNKSDLIENLSSEAGLTIKKADKLVSLVFHEMSEALAKGERVEIRASGVSKLALWRTRRQKSEDVGAVEVKPKNLPFFKCGLELKRRINSEKS